MASVNEDNHKTTLEMAEEDLDLETSDYSDDEDSSSGNVSSKNIRRKASDVDFQYQCEWNNCSHQSSSMNEFNHHVSLHRRGYTQCLGSDEDAAAGEYMFFCQWRECNASIEGHIDDFSRHVFYHTFHQYLKFLGQHIQKVEGLNSCTLDSQSRNVIPELPEKLMCRWQDCGMVYDNPYIFYSHVTHHCEDYPKGNDPKVKIKCKWEGCTATTKFWYKMKEHIRSHTQAKIVACPTCGSLFASNTRYIDHLKRQSQEIEPKFECSHCNSRFGSERILRDHMRHHVNHYKCPLCDMTCHSPSAVREHVRYRHSQERSFNCPQCDYRAKTTSDLRRHIATHADKTVFACFRPHCNKVFKFPIQLKQHYQLDHPKESQKAYECHICSQRFCRGTYLTSHLREFHTYKWPSGHKRFRYKLQEDGIYRLQTIRYESIEVSQQVLGQTLSPHPDSGETAGSTLIQEVANEEEREGDEDEQSDDYGDETSGVDGDELSLKGSSTMSAGDHSEFGDDELDDTQDKSGKSKRGRKPGSRPTSRVSTPRGTEKTSPKQGRRGKRKTGEEEAEDNMTAKKQKKNKEGQISKRRQRGSLVYIEVDVDQGPTNAQFSTEGSDHCQDELAASSVLSDLSATATSMWSGSMPSNISAISPREHPAFVSETTYDSVSTSYMSSAMSDTHSTVGTDSYGGDLSCGSSASFCVVGSMEVKTGKDRLTQESDGMLGVDLQAGNGPQYVPVSREEMFTGFYQHPSSTTQIQTMSSSLEGTNMAQLVDVQMVSHADMRQSWMTPNSDTAVTLIAGSSDQFHPSTTLPADATITPLPLTFSFSTGISPIKQEPGLDPAVTTTQEISDMFHPSTTLPADATITPLPLTFSFSTGISPIKQEPGLDPVVTTTQEISDQIYPSTTCSLPADATITPLPLTLSLSMGISPIKQEPDLDPDVTTTQGISSQLHPATTCADATITPLPLTLSFSTGISPIKQEPGLDPVVTTAQGISHQFQPPTTCSLPAEATITPLPLPLSLSTGISPIKQEPGLEPVVSSSQEMSLQTPVKKGCGWSLSAYETTPVKSEPISCDPVHTTTQEMQIKLDPKGDTSLAQEQLVIRWDSHSDSHSTHPNTSQIWMPSVHPDANMATTESDPGATSAPSNTTSGNLPQGYGSAYVPATLHPSVYLWNNSVVQNGRENSSVVTTSPQTNNPVGNCSNNITVLSDPNMQIVGDDDSNLTRDGQTHASPVKLEPTSYSVTKQEPIDTITKVEPLDFVATVEPTNSVVKADLEPIHQPYQVVVNGVGRDDVCRAQSVKQQSDIVEAGVDTETHDSQDLGKHKPGDGSGGNGAVNVAEKSDRGDISLSHQLYNLQMLGDVALSWQQPQK